MSMRETYTDDDAFNAGVGSEHYKISTQSLPSLSSNGMRIFRADRQPRAHARNAFAG